LWRRYGFIGWARKRRRGWRRRGERGRRGGWLGEVGVGVGKEDIGVITAVVQESGIGMDIDVIGRENAIEDADHEIEVVVPPVTNVAMDEMIAASPTSSQKAVQILILT
jgi:hypothetical protein